jgi:hypothetical protein
MFLTEKTYKIFEEISKITYLENFTFVGGSAVSYYFKHRLSESLDFFSWHEKLPQGIDIFIHRLSKDYNVRIVNSSDSYYDLLVNDVKVTLFANYWETLKIERRGLRGSIYVASPEFLCAMKINALSLRAKYRDYYDLYIMNKEKFPIDQMLEFSLKFIPGMTLKIFAMQLSYIADIEDAGIDHLSPKIKISLEEIRKHFETEISRLLSKRGSK